MLNNFNTDLYADNLMLPVEELKAKKIDDAVIERIIRLRDIYNYILRNPLKRERQYVEYIVHNSENLGNGKKITLRMAYDDLEVIHAIIGNLQNCTKEWHRWRFNNMIMEGYKLAVDKQDPAAIARLASAYGKYNKLDRDDEKDARYTDIPHIRFTFDVSVLGFKPIPNVNEFIDKLIKQYSNTALSEIAEDADIIEEIKDEDSRNKALPLNEETNE
jgi:hypothetical protein